MPVEIRQVGLDVAARYREVPTAFTVQSVLEPRATDKPGIVLHEVPCERPYVKDYDTAGVDEGCPARWAERWDTSNWGFFAAIDGPRTVGWAAVAVRTPGMTMLEGRDDLAVLWDIRVHPDWRRRGIGGQLFQSATRWARQQGCRQFKIETQNVNVPACRFYAAHSCRLGGIIPGPHAYPPELHHEYMLLWYLDLQ